MDTFQINRTYVKRRPNIAWWNAKKREDGLWHVNFNADFVPSENWVAKDDAELMARIAVDMAKWVEAIDAKFKPKEA